MYVRTAEAGRRLGVHRVTVVRWVRLGHLDGRRLGPGRGGRWEIKEESIERLLREAEQKKEDTK